MTGYLLDTPIVYRWMVDDRRLDRAVRRILAKEACAISGASLWEMLIKCWSARVDYVFGSWARTVKVVLVRIT